MLSTIAFPTIGINGLQVGEIIDSESNEPIETKALENFNVFEGFVVSSYSKFRFCGLLLLFGNEKIVLGKTPKDDLEQAMSHLRVMEPKQFKDLSRALEDKLMRTDLHRFRFGNELARGGHKT